MKSGTLSHVPPRSCQIAPRGTSIAFFPLLQPPQPTKDQSKIPSTAVQRLIPTLRRMSGLDHLRSVRRGRRLVVMCHFQAAAFVAAFDVETFVGFGAVEDGLFRYPAAPRQH